MGSQWVFHCFVAQLLRSIVVAASEIEGALAQLLRKPGKMVYRYDKDWGGGGGWHHKELTARK